MSVITISSVLVSLCAIFSFINYKMLKLPAAIGIMILALALSVIIIALPNFGFNVQAPAQEFLGAIDFSETLLHGMLSFLLFAGALHVNLDDLGKLKTVVGSLAIFGTLFSTAVVGFLSYELFTFFGFHIDFIYCLIFGSLISPTDPVAVMAILKKAGASKSLETKVVGESLFNDGVAVVLFLVLVGIASGGEATASSIGSMFLQEAGGGVLLGGILGFTVYKMLSSIDNYQVEILLTLALVMGGYELALLMHVSGPIAMVVAGLLIGNQGRKFAMSETTRTNLDNFWELCDEFLNAVLFLLIGLEILMLSANPTAFKVGLIMIPILLAVRMVAVSVPIMLLKSRQQFSDGVIKVLTWGGLRGGISVALVLSLDKGDERDFLLIVTYCIVLFSIIVQGLTIGKLVKSTQS